MAALQTRKTGKSVSEFIGGIEDDGVRKDCKTLLALFREVTGEPARMWGPAIVGFGDYHYRSRSREYEWFLAGFSPRKQNLTLYLMSGYEPFPALMKKLGKHSTGKSCLYIKRLSDVDMPTLKKLIEESTRRMKADPRFAQ
jgi:hypothetical protein